MAGEWFTFHYGSIKGVEDKSEPPTPYRFTFHYGSIKGNEIKQEHTNIVAIYIPLWFY